MVIKGLGAQVEKVWNGLRPTTREMLTKALQKKLTSSKFFYDVHSDWELSRLLTALDEQLAKEERKLSDKKNKQKINEIKLLAETCANVLQSQTESAEVFIQLVERALKQKDYAKIEATSQILNERFSAGEVCEIIRQTTNPVIRALAYESLALFPSSSLILLAEDPIYGEIARNALEIQAFDYNLEEAQKALEELNTAE
jgi:preprotein translocase subunit SecD